MSRRPDWLEHGLTVTPSSPCHTHHLEPTISHQLRFNTAEYYILSLNSLADNLSVEARSIRYVTCWSVSSVCGSKMLIDLVLYPWPAQVNLYPHPPVTTETQPPTLNIIDLVIIIIPHTAWEHSIRVSHRIQAWMRVVGGPCEI
jgi:hypothetical protein